MTDVEQEALKIFPDSPKEGVYLLSHERVRRDIAEAIQRAEQRGCEAFKTAWKDVYAFPYSEFDGSWAEWYVEHVKRLEKVQQAIRKEAEQTVIWRCPDCGVKAISTQPKEEKLLVTKITHQCPKAKYSEIDLEENDV